MTSQLDQATARALAALVQWRPVPGYEQTYRVSDQGAVCSIARPRTPGGLLAWSFDRYGYPRVTLVQDGRQATIRVHLLVMRAFVGPAPEGMEVCHRDGDSSNPRLDNLRYDTHRANLLDAVSHGTNAWAARTHCPQGHPYNAANTARYPSDPRHRYCIACRRTSGLASWRRRHGK